MRDRTTAAVVGLTLVGGLVRFLTLGDQSFWFDEVATVSVVGSSFPDMIRGVGRSEMTPPLYYGVAWLWWRVFGHSETGLRSLSAVAGTLTIPVAYEAGRLLISKRAGLVVAAIAALSPALIWYSQEARSYSLLVLLCAISLVMFARAERSPSTRAHAGWAVASALALTTHYFAAFFVVPEALWLLARGPNRRAAAWGTGGVAAAALLVAPLALHQSARDNADWIATIPFGDRIHDAAAFFGDGHSKPGHHLTTIFLALSFAAIVIALWAPGRGRRNGAALALGLGAATIAIPLFLPAVGIDFFIDRNLLPAWLPIAIAVAAGLTATRRPWVKGAGLAIGVFGLAYFAACDYKLATDESVQRADWKGVARLLGPARTDRAVLVWPQRSAEELRLYMPGLAPLPGSAAVGEIYTVTQTEKLPFPVSERPPLRLDPAFRPVQTTRVQRFRVVRYRAARATALAPSAPPGARPIGFFLQRPGS